MSTYTPIASQTLGSAAASVTFSSIPQGYTDLVLVVKAKAATTEDNIYLRFNSDSGSTYSVTNLVGNGSSTLSNRFSSTFIWFDYSMYMRTSDFSTAVMNFQNYSNSTTFKTCLIRNNIASVGTSASVGLWRNTAPITEINVLTTGFASGSTFSLYGIQVGNAAQKAQGGNIVTSDGTYVYHTFTSSGSFIPSQALTVDYLVVAGGGGGGDTVAGGGGAGGLRSTVTATGGGGSLESALSLSSGKSYPVIIGAGGAGALSGSYPNGTSGSNSIFTSITSTGGGGGGSYSNSNGLSGGSGGGGGGGEAGTNASGGTASPSNQGYAGGVGRAAGNGSFAGGGGGGAGATGAAAASAAGGNGGNGVAVSISGSSVTYAGGGGGGGGSNSFPSGTGGTGGTGGGGAGGTRSTASVAGTANTGGGAGGGGNNSYTLGAAGGSGIVIIRYAI